jgi:carbon storage regulator CsrA
LIQKNKELLYTGGSAALTFACWVKSQHSNVSDNAEAVMLILKRREGEEIFINDDLRIVVTKTTDGSCSLAIEAPDSYRIRRGELPAFSEVIIQKTASALQVQS